MRASLLWTVTVAVGIVAGYVNGLYVAWRRMRERIPSEVGWMLEDMGTEASIVGNEDVACAYYAAAHTVQLELENRFA